MDHGAPTSYLVLETGTDVFAADGGRVGEVKRVLAVPDDDIFDGLILDTADGKRFVDAENVDEIYERGVVLAVDAAAAQSLPEPAANPAIVEVGADDMVKEDLGDKLKRAWDRISGKD
jgi:hypothetical protein